MTNHETGYLPATHPKSTRYLEEFMYLLPGWVQRLVRTDDGGIECTMWIDDQICQLESAFPVLRSQTKFGDYEASDESLQGEMTHHERDIIDDYISDKVYTLLDRIEDIVRGRCSSAHPYTVVHTKHFRRYVRLFELRDSDYLCWDTLPIDSLQTTKPLDEIDPDDVAYAGQMLCFLIPVSISISPEFAMKVIMPCLNDHEMRLRLIR